MMKRLWLIVLMLAPLAVLAQQVLVSGTVVDDKSGNPLRQVSVSAGRVSVVTNEDGVFALKLEKQPSAIKVSHVGYKTRQVKLSQENTQGLKVRLVPTTIQLREIVVRTANPRELVDIAISKIPENYSKVPELLKAFYRETAMKRKHYIYVAEGVEDMYKTPYTRSVHRDRVSIVKGRRLLSQKQGDTLGVKVLGGPVLPVQLDVVKNHDILLNKEELDGYKFSMDIPEYINDRLQYVVRIEPGVVKDYALFNGRFYIDSERLAFTRIELELDMTDKEKATNRMLVKKPFGVKFKPRELSCVIDYRYEDGVSRISYLSNIFRFNCDWKKRLLATSFTATCEMVVTDSQSQDVQPIANRSSFDSKDAYYDKVEYFMDPEYWSQYNIIEPSESLDKAIRKLVSKYRRN
ncbi:MAG: carboxypeptidase-like regulatory domain-containing protein [Prevotella sp.]|nr:carboxypeptidase-like regulatory domain-containing protein [Prevotella sp.]